MAATLKLANTSPAQSFTEPLSLADAKAFLGIADSSPADTATDDYVEALIAAARSWCEGQYRRDLVEKTWVLTLDDFPAGEIRLRSPLASVSSITYTDSGGAVTTVSSTEYVVDTAKGIVAPAYEKSWPSFTAWPSSAVAITFVSGYGSTDVFWSDAGRVIRQAMLMLIREWFTNREPNESRPYGVSRSTMTAIERLASAGGLEVVA